MGMCCSVGRHETQVEPCHGHHSFYVHPEGSLNNSTFNIVYRPPHLNERLAPGEAKPRFWMSPSNIIQGPAVVSVAWCQLCQPQSFSNPPRQNNNKRLNKRKNNRVDTGHRHDDALEISASNMEDHMEGDKNMMVKAYPSFLLPYINKTIRLRLVFMDPKVEQLVGEYGHLKHSREAETDPMMETSYLVRNMHSLKLHLKYSCIVQGLPEVQLEENHGGVKRLKRVRYRNMPVCWIDLDHRKPNIHVAGEQFELSLGPPCPSLTPDDFPDGNGETPMILGTYVRALDTAPERRLKFSARLFHWFNHSSECYSDVMMGHENIGDKYIRT
ncbi:unnamed protein product [Lymnaea stagnalis]|uniref:Uncharacterized protein n=1 Tax=Lymnaea stagnalis TaxID=6523 RepID=A0AAV2I5Q0_LYMST